MLAKKWGVLKFLLEFSDSQDEGVVLPEPPRPATALDEREQEDREILSRSFATHGLHSLPMRGAPRDQSEMSFGDQRGELRTKAAILAEGIDGFGILLRSEVIYTGD